LKKDFEFVIIDCPAGIEQGYKNAVAGADKAIVVTTPEHAAVRDADRIIGLLEQDGLKGPKLIINRVKPSMIRKGEMLEIDDILQVLAIDLLGVVPDDESVIRACHGSEIPRRGCVPQYRQAHSGRLGASHAAGGKKQRFRQSEEAAWNRMKRSCWTK
jgi:septum site-determining protein MinD